jgi:GTP pyrophosphokinase
MRTLAATAATEAAPIVALADESTEGSDALSRAIAFAQPLLQGHALDSGEDAFAHSQGVAALLAGIGGAPALQAAAYLVYAGDFLQKPDEVVAKAFGQSYAGLVSYTRKLVAIERAARQASPQGGSQQLERVRKMLLAFSQDLRVVLLRLASRLQTLRWHAASKTPCPREVAQESRDVFAPLANRLGIGQFKWEIEDLAFRFLEPEPYKSLARSLDETRAEREARALRASNEVAFEMSSHGLPAQVQGRPKHLYSIWKKMQAKGLDLGRVMDLTALRIIVADVPACYAALARAHERWPAVAEEFDDYIAKPKANGYQSLHTVVRMDGGRPAEIQIRTRAMHEHAEYGVAAHWVYKEKNYGSSAGAGASPDERIAQARKAVLRQLLAWERDIAQPQAQQLAVGDERIYVFTPQATIIELALGATPIDFAYALHTDLGHRCRGARVDGALVPLSTPLASGQTVEITAAKEGGPSLDWLNPDLHFLASQRSKAKVRAWFNAQAQAHTIAKGRDLVEKLLQREGKTAVEREELADRLGFKSAEALYEVVGKDELSLRTIEQLLRPAAPPEPETQAAPLLKRSKAQAGGVLVVGVESLLTSLARCCRPAPPDDIDGFVTRGKGVAIHRRGCSNLAHMRSKSPDRVIPVAWGGAKNDAALYPMDVQIEALDRPALLRDITEVFAKEKVNVTGAKTQNQRGTAFMTFTVEVAAADRLTPVLAQVAQVSGVRHVRRK